MITHDDIELLSRALQHAARSSTLPTAHGGVEIPLIFADLVLQQPADLRKQGEWTAFWQENVHHYKLGEILVSVESTPAPALDHNGVAVVQYGAEVRLVGVVANMRDVLGIAFVNSGSGPARFALRAADTVYAQLQLEGRMIVNGAPDSQTESDQLAAQVAGRVGR